MCKEDVSMPHSINNEDLRSLIQSRWFDDYQIGLNSRFTSYGYSYHYSQDSVIVLFDKNDVKIRIQFFDNGILHFNVESERKTFRDCSANDFHTMLAHSFIYLRDGNFDYHKVWFENLNKV